MPAALRMLVLMKVHCHSARQAYWATFNQMELQSIFSGGSCTVVQVTQVACGMHHTLLLATSRSQDASTKNDLSILGCGGQKHGQLGLMPLGVIFQPDSFLS